MANSLKTLIAAALICSLAAVASAQRPHGHLHDISLSTYRQNADSTTTATFSLGLQSYADTLHGVAVNLFGTAAGHEMKGVGVGGFITAVFGNATGALIAPLSNNVTGTMRGLQLSAISNYAHSLRGAQVGGLYNISSTPMRGLQFSPATNISYGINHDASNCYGENVCWWNTRPFPLDFQFYQTIPASKIKPGLYRIRCLLWCKQGDLGTCRLFANNNVQYFGKESDYDKNLTEGETATFAGHKGTSGATFILHEMEVTTSIEAGESLTLGIRTSCLKPDGTQATSSESTGWFKVDHFRIERIEGDGTGIGTIENGKLNIESSESPFNLQSSIFNNNVYNLAGQQVSKASNGIYIQNGKKFLTP